MNHDEFGKSFENEKSFGKSFEDKYKFNMLEIEKRFVKLETTVKEVLDVMEQVEDSVNVEQAGVEELKKMLEERPLQQSKSQQGMQGISPANFSGASKEEIDSLKKGLRELADSVRRWQVEVEKLKSERRSQPHDTHDTQQMQGMKDEVKNEIANVVKSELKNEITNEIMNEIKQVKAEMEHGMARFQSTQSAQSFQSVQGQRNVGNERMSEQVEMLKRRISDIEDSMQSLAEFSKIQLQPTRSSVYEQEVNDLLEKIVFLESKVSTLEQLFSRRTQQETQRQDIRTEIVSRPLIME